MEVRTKGKMLTEKEESNENITQFKGKLGKSFYQADQPSTLAKSKPIK